MKKIITMVLAAVMSLSCINAFAEEIEQPYIEPYPYPVIKVDENFDTDRQDFLNSDNVGLVKVLYGNENNRLIDLSSGKPYIDEKQRIRVPIRAYAESMGCEVIWSQENEQIIINSYNPDNNEINDWLIISPGKNTVACKPFGAEPVVSEIVMDCVPEIVDDITYLPLRHIANLLGEYVVWDENTLTVNVYNNAVMSVNSGVIYYKFPDDYEP